jgi:hypothetical protein
LYAEGLFKSYNAVDRSFCDAIIITIMPNKKS